MGYIIRNNNIISVHKNCECVIVEVKTEDGMILDTFIVPKDEYFETEEQAKGELEKKLQKEISSLEAKKAEMEQKLNEIRERR